jgi:hypothetical protein
MLGATCGLFFLSRRTMATMMAMGTPITQAKLRNAQTTGPSKIPITVRCI